MAERGAHSPKRESGPPGLQGGLEPSSITAREAREGSVEGGLHVCPACDSELVHPVAWEGAGNGRWHVWLRCPDCEWIGDDTYEQAVVDRFDEALDRGTETVLGDLKALTRANMEEDIDRFLDALGADHVLPEDF